MARAVEDHWAGPLKGLVVTRYGHRVPTRAIEVVEAAHPVPDTGGREAAARILSLAEDLSADDLALCLVFRRRLGASHPAGAGDRTRRQAGDDRRAAALGRRHRRN